MRLSGYLAGTCFTLVLLIGVPGTTAATAQPADPDSPAANLPKASALVSTVLDNYAGDNNKPTQRYYADGVWHNSDNTQKWSSTQGGAALAAASLWSATGRTDDRRLRQAIDTINTAITHQTADGSFAPPPGPGEQSPGAIATEFFGQSMGYTYLLVQSQLTSMEKQAWVSSIQRAADYLIQGGHTAWYANGNVNLGYTVLLYLAWRASGEARFAEAYDAEWAFTLAPNSARWPGFGLRLVSAPSRSDGSDGSGYLAESGSGGIGFDAEYSMWQLTQAKNLYLVSHDPRALRLSNLLMNVLLPRITADFQLDTAGGTRHTETSRAVPFLSSASAVLPWVAGRNDLAPRVHGYVDEVESAFTVSLPWPSNPNYYGALGADLGVMLWATTVAVSIVPAPGTAQPTLPSPPMPQGVPRPALAPTTSTMARTGPAVTSANHARTAKSKTCSRAIRARHTRGSGRARKHPVPDPCKSRRIAHRRAAKSLSPG